MATQTATRLHSHNSYTVGWICALPKEQTAATVMLDHVHPELPNPPNDANIYTLGSIGAHDVVIACLPKGKYGTISAATVATRMVDTFPSIRFGLMVGIGGGVPPKVRLGDVVVSCPVDQYPGVIQWDLGKAEEALTKLETKHELQGSRIPEYLDDLRDNWPSLVPKYIGSASLRDPEDFHGMYNTYVLKMLWNAILFILGFIFGQPDIRTRPTTKESTAVHRGPQVHYGLIASGNQVIKDARLRDVLDNSLGGNVLCVEMEAAGLMDNFPCIVIRGICDYADSHKNKDWQEHAAAVAAAFAKELLSMVPTQEVERMPAIELLSGIDKKLDTVSNVVGKICSRQHDKEHQAILDWLTPTDYAPQQSDNLGRRKPGTGQWLLDSKVFHNWLNSRGQTLFCPGIPGAGKTIITSAVVDKLQSLYQEDDNVGVAYVYCNFRHQEVQTAMDFVASLLKQLTQGQAVFPDVVESLHAKCKERRSRPSFEDISSALQSVTALYSRVFILVDALDESHATNGTRAKLFHELSQLKAKSATNIFATSRFIPEISNEFTESIVQEIRATEEDVRIYLQDDLVRLPTFVRNSPSLQERIKREIVSSVQGMFLLANLHLDSLTDKTSVKAVRSALAALPKGSGAYDEAYEEAMKRVETQPSGYRALAKQVLAWIVCAKRPLTTVELRHALAVELDQTRLDLDAFPDIEIMVSVCAGLVTVDEQSNIFRLVHYTTQQYFEKISTRQTWLPNAERNITATCLTYLLFDEFESGPCRSYAEFASRLTSHALYDYVAQRWGDHAREAGTLPKKVMQFLRHHSKMGAACQALIIGNEGLWRLRDLDEVYGLPPLQLSAFFGINEAADTLVDSGEGIDSTDTCGRTPLFYAAAGGHARTVELLVERGARVNLEDQRGMTPLSEAALNGHVSIAKLLVRNGADLELQDPLAHRTPLAMAAENGWTAIVDILLTHYAGLVMAARDQAERTGAAQTTYTSIMSRKQNGHNLLTSAAKNGQDSMVRLLLERGADIESTCQEGYTATELAAYRGHQSTAELLLDHAEPQKHDRKNIRLYCAVRFGQCDVAKRLLSEGGVDAHYRDEDGRTLLSWAVENDLGQVVSLLLAKSKMTLNLGDRHGRSPFWFAARNGHKELKLLLASQGGTL
ncbi:ankyrin repeats (3 copies) domain-containing protein [Hirsutella rhossiliensis]|uniref:Ankyrin repeats (3 copies) domain-containing protein n=1 Tax=Hirsutella rhossiliensis TaxID=111463 RepID=A0A9P8N3R8_9HYPO|nr:ankyrin repeats (3 copies) domain-containing protein [Hirsutella rhossiliensis]KAH0966360.1 ankyrin repeats (3 copies) domain-containing protein [Hirsutella rhossiliensis]